MWVVMQFGACGNMIYDARFMRLACSQLGNFLEELRLHSNRPRMLRRPFRSPKRDPTDSLYLSSPAQLQMAFLRGR